MIENFYFWDTWKLYTRVGRKTTTWDCELCQMYLNPRNYESIGFLNVTTIPVFPVYQILIRKFVILRIAVNDIGNKGTNCFSVCCRFSFNTNNPAFPGPAFKWDHGTTPILAVYRYRRLRIRWTNSHNQTFSNIYTYKILRERWMEIPNPVLPKKPLFPKRPHFNISETVISLAYLGFFLIGKEWDLYSVLLKFSWEYYKRS